MPRKGALVLTRWPCTPTQGPTPLNSLESKGFDQQLLGASHLSCPFSGEEEKAKNQTTTHTHTKTKQHEQQNTRQLAAHKGPPPPESITWGLSRTNSRLRNQDFERRSFGRVQPRAPSVPAAEKSSERFGRGSRSVGSHFGVGNGNYHFGG